MSYNLLKGKRGIIFGALNEQSIAWKVAEKAVKEGATITLSNTPVAVRMGEVSALSEKLNCEVIPADATSVEDLENVFKRSMEVLGGPVDFVLHSIGMSPNVRKKRTYDDLDYDMLEKTLDISAVSFHKMIQAAKKLNAIADYGSILALSYVAAQRTFYGYNDMADAKALLESIARSFGYIYGREHHVRVNTISQSPTMTTAGSGVKGMDKLFDFANRMSPLGNASADECADYCIVMFSDLTRKVTMQNLFHDGGFSSVGMSLRAMATYEKGLDEYKDENGNIILTEGLVLQDEKIWRDFLKKEIFPKSNSCELYFEEKNIEKFIEKLEKLYPSIQYVNRLMTHSWGQKVIRFYDLDGNLIEVGTPV